MGAAQLAARALTVITAAKNNLRVELGAPPGQVISNHLRPVILSLWLQTLNNHHGNIIKLGIFIDKFQYGVFQYIYHFLRGFVRVFLNQRF